MTLPAFARSSVSFAPARADRRKDRDCGCAGKCGGCASKKRRDQRPAARGAAGVGHDFAQLDARKGHYGRTSFTTCDREDGKVKFEIYPACASRTVEVHEEAHAEHRGTCCERYSKCWHNASSAADKQACESAWTTWFEATKDWSECEACKVEKPYLEAFIALNCEGQKDKADEPGTGAGIGAAIGGVGGLAGGIVLGEHLAQGSSLAGGAGGAIGGLLGAIGGAIGGALIGFAVGHIVRAVKYENVSGNCCDDLKNMQMFNIDQGLKESCPHATWIDCPFDADGRIINRPSAAGGAGR